MVERVELPLRWPFIPASLSLTSTPATDTRWMPAAINLVAAAGNGHEPGFTRRAMSVDRASDSVHPLQASAQPQLLDVRGRGGGSPPTGSMW